MRPRTAALAEIHLHAEMAMLYARGSDTCSVEYTGQLSVVDSRTHRPSRGTRYSALYGESESGVLAAAVVRNGPAELVCGRVRVRCAALRGARCSVRAVGRGELPDAAGRARPRPTEIEAAARVCGLASGARVRRERGGGRDGVPGARGVDPGQRATRRSPVSGADTATNLHICYPALNVDTPLASRRGRSGQVRTPVSRDSQTPARNAPSASG